MHNYKLDPNKYESLGEEAFLNGYNCSQSIVLAFSDILDIDKDALLKLSSPFGGGYSRIREMCGAISGAFMVIGLLKGYNTPEAGDKKAELYTLGQEFIKRFEAEFIYCRCYQLLDKKEGMETPIPSIRNKEFYQNRPCKKYIGRACYILATLLSE